MPFAIEPMQFEDVQQVVEIEKICFSTPWPASAYRRELRNSSSTRYLVVRNYEPRPGTAAPDPVTSSKYPPILANLLSFSNKEESKESALPRDKYVVGYAGLWMMMDEAHVTTLGVEPTYRGNHLGELLLVGLIEVAMQMGASWLTLEVRVSNTVAQNLYKKYSFSTAGVRRKYYTDNNEDAYIMWSEEITKPEFREKLAVLKNELKDRLIKEGKVAPDKDLYAPLLNATTAQESPSTDTGQEKSEHSEDE